MNRAPSIDTLKNNGKALRTKTAKRGYGAEWRKLRRWHLIRHPLCNRCYKRGESIVALDVHHIVPIADGGARLDPANLESLCRACHNVHHKAKMPKRHDENKGQGGPLNFER